MEIAVVMILRVYAMWNRSTRILYILLFLYVPQVIVSFIYEGFYSNRTTYPGMSQANCKLVNWNLICGPLSPTIFFPSHSCSSG